MRRGALIACLVLILSGLFVVRQLFPRGRKPYSTDIGALHARFNQDAGKVRLLLLLSPT